MRFKLLRRGGSCLLLIDEPSLPSAAISGIFGFHTLGPFLFTNLRGIGEPNATITNCGQHSQAASHLGRTGFGADAANGMRGDVPQPNAQREITKPVQTAVAIKAVLSVIGVSLYRFWGINQNSRKAIKKKRPPTICGLFGNVLPTRNPYRKKFRRRGVFTSKLSSLG